MGQTLRSLAAKVGITLDECVEQLRPIGLKVVVGKQRLDGHDLTDARELLRDPAAAW